MQDLDPELEHLKEAERKARGLFQRMSETRAQLSDSVVLRAAEDLWKEATAAVLTYEAHSRGE